MSYGFRGDESADEVFYFVVEIYLMCEKGIDFE